MRHHQTEELLLGVIIKNNDTDIPIRVVRELSVASFTKPELKKIYSAICEVVKKGQPPDPANINLQLNGDTSYGGYDYLLSLINIPDVLHINSNGSLSNIVEEVDSVGRLWHFWKNVQKEAKHTQNFEEWCREVTDVDEYLSNFAKEIRSKEVPKTKSKPISVALDKALHLLNRGMKGEVFDIIPCGIPQFRPHHIPRPRSVGVILGFPSTGKTSLALQMLIGAAYELKQSNMPGKVHFQSLDTTEENIGKSIGYMLARIDSMIPPHQLSNDQKARLVCCIEWAKTLPIEYNDNLLTSYEMKKEALWASYESPRVLNISDYAEKFSDKNRESEELRMSQIIHNHREVAWETGSCEILLSQPGPDAVKSGSKIATLSDARYTRSFEQVADWGLVIWNPPAMRARQISFQLPKERREDQAVIFIQKNKGYAPSETFFEWVPQYSMFRDISLPMNHFWDSEPWQFVEPEW